MASDRVEAASAVRFGGQGLGLSGLVWSAEAGTMQQGGGRGQWSAVGAGVSSEMGTNEAQRSQ